mgnify:CR=1 FL=1
MSELLPAESMALTVALAQLARGENPPPNTSAACIFALERLRDAGEPPTLADDTVQVPRAVLMDLHAAAKDIEDELPALVRMGDHLARRVGGSAIFPSAEAAIRSADFLATTLKALYGSERGDHG